MAGLEEIQLVNETGKYLTQTDLKELMNLNASNIQFNPANFCDCTTNNDLTSIILYLGLLALVLLIINLILFFKVKKMNDEKKQ